MTTASSRRSDEKSREILVFIVRRQDSRCGECGAELVPGSFIRLRRGGGGEEEAHGEGEALCLDCADLGHLKFLPSGDTAVTRRASKHSPLRAIVLEWSTARKRYERQGILATRQAIERAEAECLADAPLRQRRQLREAARRAELDEKYVEQFAQAVRGAYPGCPETEARDIAEHACLRNSGRVGRSAAAKSFDADAVHLAVVAHVRHVHTGYDKLLARGVDRYEARDIVRADVEAVLDRWSEA